MFVQGSTEENIEKFESESDKWMASMVTAARQGSLDARGWVKKNKIFFKLEKERKNHCFFVQCHSKSYLQETN